MMNCTLKNTLKMKLLLKLQTYNDLRCLKMKKRIFSFSVAHSSPPTLKHVILVYILGSEKTVPSLSFIHFYQDHIVLQVLGSANIS